MKSFGKTLFCFYKQSVLLQQRPLAESENAELLTDSGSVPDVGTPCRLCVAEGYISLGTADRTNSIAALKKPLPPGPDSHSTLQTWCVSE